MTQKENKNCCSAVITCTVESGHAVE